MLSDKALACSLHFQFKREELGGVDIWVLCRPVTAFHTKLEKFYDLNVKHLSLFWTFCMFWLRIGCLLIPWTISLFTAVRWQVFYSLWWCPMLCGASTYFWPCNACVKKLVIHSTSRVQFSFMTSASHSAFSKNKKAKQININILNGGFVYRLWVNLGSLAILHCIM